MTEKRTVLNQISIDLKRDYSRLLDRKQEAISNFKNTINLLHPINTMKRGYSVVRSKGKAVSSINNLQLNSKVEVQLIDGQFEATIDEIHKSDGK